MSNSRESNEGVGCAIVLVLMAIAAVVAAAISLAALVDPLDWMPTVNEIWADCDDTYGGPDEDCALAHRFPGFWWHAVANLVYAIVALCAVLAFGATVSEVREKRVDRFESAVVAAAHRTAHGECVRAGVVLAVVALLPIVVAVA